MKKWILLCSLMATSLTSAAGWETGRIQFIGVGDQLGWNYVELDGNKEHSPGCATSTRWAIQDEYSDFGKQQMSLLQLAAEKGWRVHIIGKGNCNRYPGYEDISLVHMYTN